MKRRTALVTGATGQLGSRLLPRLLELYDDVVGVSRNPGTPGGRLRWITADLEREADVARIAAASRHHPDAPLPQELDVFHLAPLWLLFPLLDRLTGDDLVPRGDAQGDAQGDDGTNPAGGSVPASAGGDRCRAPDSSAAVAPAVAAGVKSAANTAETGDSTALVIGRLIAFGSTSRFTKMDSRCAAERRIAAALAGAEEQVKAVGTRRGICWTVLRPTMVYGADMDHTVTLIRRMIRRFGFFPVAGRARGRRQPVHVDDLVAAVLAVRERPATFGRAYNLGGGEVLTYREMVERIFRREGKRPRIVPLPAAVLYLLLRPAVFLGLTGPVPMAMIRRQNRDLCFDNRPAATDFGWAPRGFE